MSVVRLKTDLYTAIFIASPTYFAFTIFIFHRLRNNRVGSKLLIVTIGVIIVHVIPRLFDFEAHMISIPEFISELVGIIFGLLFFYSNKIGRVFSSLCVLALLFLTYYLEADVVNIMLHNEYAEEISKRDIRLDEVAYFERNSAICYDSIFNNNTVYIVDFWTTSCMPCIRLFPLIDETHKEYISNRNIKVKTICMLDGKESMNSPYNLVQKKGFSFPINTVYYNDSVANLIGINSFPTTLVIKNKEVYFRGSFEAAIDVANKLLNQS